MVLRLTALCLEIHAELGVKQYSGTISLMRVGLRLAAFRISTLMPIPSLWPPLFHTKCSVASAHCYEKYTEAV